MTPLRQKMTDAMCMRDFSVRAHESYLSAVSELVCYYGRSPEGLDVEELQAFFAHLAIKRGLSGATCRSCDITTANVSYWRYGTYATVCIVEVFASLIARHPEPPFPN